MGNMVIVSVGPGVIRTWLAAMSNNIIVIMEPGVFQILYAAVSKVIVFMKLGLVCYGLGLLQWVWATLTG